MTLFFPNSRSNFEELISKVGNSGHLLIRAGFESIQTSVSANVLEIWDENIGTSKCTCKSRNKTSEILLASSIISHENLIINSSDFRKINSTLEHVMKFHRLSSVIGLGINGAKDNSIKFEKLDNIQKQFLGHLQSREISIGCRGLETLEFLISCGFARSKLFLTGCPSIQLITEPIDVITESISKVLVNGALIHRLDLIQANIHEKTQILFIPQTVDSLHYAKIITNIDDRIEVFLPNSLKSWQEKIRNFKPQIALGTRFHGNIAALSERVPTVFMSGDIRTKEITDLARLPFFDDLRSISEAVKQLNFISSLERNQAILEAKLELLNCLKS